MTSIQNNSGTTQAAGCAKECTGTGKIPPTPQIRVSIATEGVAKDGSQFYPQSPPAPSFTARPDPAYIEIGNWEPGTTFELINLSANPTASFDCAKDVISLDPTGRDVVGRIASIWIDEKEMEKLGFKSGHLYRIRAIDPDGMVSADTLGKLEGRTYQRGTIGNIYEDQAWKPGHQIQLLDGENLRENFLLKHIADTSAPEIKHFQKEAKLLENDAGQVELVSKNSLEPRAPIEVMNGRTGQVYSGQVGEDQSLRVALGELAHHDMLVVTVRDEAGNEAAKVELRYGETCKDGRASDLGILAARLQPSIKRPKAANG
jgi:hypothetical protein